MEAKAAWKDIQRRICKCSDTNCIDCRVIEEKQRIISNALEALETIASAKREDEAVVSDDAINNYVQLEDVRIPLEDTFEVGGGNIHLPMCTFLQIVRDRNLEVQVVPRHGDDGEFPFQYQAKLQKGTGIYAISDREILFD